MNKSITFDISQDFLSTSLCTQTIQYLFPQSSNFEHYVTENNDVLLANK